MSAIAKFEAGEYWARVETFTSSPNPNDWYRWVRVPRHIYEKMQRPRRQETQHLTGKPYRPDPEIFGTPEYGELYAATGEPFKSMLDMQELAACYSASITLVETDDPARYGVYRTTPYFEPLCRGKSCYGNELGRAAVEKLIEWGWEAQVMDVTGDLRPFS
jgi:hypothetical protein